ncbi:hypothetical protein CRG98_027575 [Punica granatum]|uniref:Uncharacterized protein n=1 Tax=Punica granatum TaxID=22663 RepID=A0A2I0J7L4_PUNGR|nr:hypothetical protein CRG98_027575 [Punica granatum]
MKMNSGSCNIIKRATGTEVSAMIGKKIHLNLSLRTICSAAPNATIMVAMARNKDANPNINLFGSTRRKSSSAYRAVRIDKNIKMAVVEEKRAKASDAANNMKTCLFKNSGVPLPSTLPPGTVKAAAKTTVAMRGYCLLNYGPTWCIDPNRSGKILKANGYYFNYAVPHCYRQNMLNCKGLKYLRRSHIA